MFSRKTSLFGLAATLLAALTSGPALALPLSPGDRLRLFIPGEEGLPEAERLSATYEVNLDGTLKIPYIPPIPVAGREVEDIEAQLAQDLVARGFFQPQSSQLSLQIFEWAPVQVTIAGAVFDPGRVLINQAESKGRDLPASIATVSGDYPPERYLTSALQLVGGIKPNADVRNVRVLRGNREQVVDLSGVFTGSPVDDIPLAAGDQVIVPELAEDQPNLVRPSQITPTTVRVFFSNLAEDNARGNAGTVEQFAYGARFSQAVVAANCVGGKRSVNAKRTAVLIRTDRDTGETVAMERPVESLIKDSGSSEANPFLLPEDSVVCYDSNVQNLAGVFNFLNTVLNPISVIKRIIFE
ncbi:polysaccharide biosynthesis/export family protein [Geitlerinema sp. PCC 7407]|uniref:polysaccharide biosynthesis/export family protein n=1 Tax=Geitlerinema sp. PCC 7407 TaxID=1173025 RepID=UPI00029FA476|nr:polysaccharide biosynthesis/export family protein [Geitlerinema sp. PCC 7407]AFY65465.1 polysaccharide export protein [Geitlerinema sp. PCC 7407]